MDIKSREKRSFYIPISEIRLWLNEILKYYKNNSGEPTTSEKTRVISEARIVFNENDTVSIFYIDSKKYTNIICQEIDIILDLKVNSLGEQEHKSKQKSNFQTFLNLLVPRSLKTKLHDTIDIRHKSPEIQIFGHKIGYKSEKDIYANVDGTHIIIEDNYIKAHIGEVLIDRIADFFIRKSIFTPEVVQNQVKSFKNKAKYVATDIKYKNSKEIHKDFLNTKWYCYERIKKGVVKNEVSFLNKLGNHVNVEVSYFVFIDEDDLTKCTKYTYSGKATCLITAESQYLILDLFRNEDPHTPASFYMRIDVGRETKQTVSIGHFTFFSINFKRFHTKLAIWEKVEYFIENEPLKDKYFSLNTKERFQTIVDENGINKDNHYFFKTFLDNRNLNKLTMPEEIISHVFGKNVEYSLEYWISERRGETKNKNYLIGEYWCYYYVGEFDENESIVNIHVNKLVVVRDIYKGFYYAILYNSQNETDIYWFGDLFYSKENNILELQLNEYKYPELLNYGAEISLDIIAEQKLIGDSRIFVTIELPEFFKNSPNKISNSLMSGLISGYKREPLNTPSTFLMVVNKGSEIKLDEKSNPMVNQIVNFFKKNREKLSLNLKHIQKP